MEVLLKKELGIQIINGEEFKNVSKFVFWSLGVAYEAYKRLNDKDYKILLRKSTKWEEITFNELEIRSEKIRKRLGTKIKRKKIQ